MRRLIALIPAHNEQDGIARTLESLLSQAVAPERIIVMADNCTDLTVERALAAGAEVQETVGNAAKKAGALNQGQRTYLPGLSDSDYVICMDADGPLEGDFVSNALELFATRANLGASPGPSLPARLPTSWRRRRPSSMRVGPGRCRARPGRSTSSPERAQSSRSHALRRVAAARGTELPGEPGSWFMEDSLTEDYELTLAIKKLGYIWTSTKRCRVTTDVMPTFRMLSTQELRWYRGALWPGPDDQRMKARRLGPVALVRTMSILGSWSIPGGEPVWACAQRVRNL